MEETSGYTKLLSHMKRHGYKEEYMCEAVALLDNMKRLQVGNTDQFQHDLENVVARREQYLDYYAEGKAALRLATYGFRIIMRPQGRGGADMLATWSNAGIYIEVARFREDPSLTERLRQGGPCDTLVEYGHGEKGVSAVYSKILEEASQLPPDEIGLVLIESNMPREDIEFEQACWYLNRLVSREQTYSYLSGVLFDNQELIKGRRFYLWLNTEAARPIPPAVAQKLEALNRPARYLQG
jgi:hypothetical protein